MIGTDYEEFDDAAYTKFRRKLLRTKGGAHQKNFLIAARNNENFLKFVRDDIATVGVKVPALCPERLTEDEFKHPPANTEMALYKAWGELTPRIACRTTFWGNLTCHHIESGRISAVYLAANGGTGISGAERIDRVLNDDGKTAAKSIDDCVRTLLRRLSGLPEARGNRTVYVDCPLARAWWRERLVAEISQSDQDRAKKVREVSRVNQTYWEELVTLVVSRNSVLGSHEVRDSFILSLADLITKESETPLRNAKNLRLACRMIGIIQASRELSVLDDSEVRTIMDEILALQHKQALSRKAGDE